MNKAILTLILVISILISGCESNKEEYKYCIDNCELDFEECVAPQDSDLEYCWLEYEICSDDCEYQHL